MTNSRVPPRISFRVALASNKAIVFRRGPSQWTQLLVWDLNTDKVQKGQWFKGRVFDYLCDFSANGDYMIYFAAKHHSRNEEYKSTFTAVSKPPYYTALALWPIGHSWYGGGSFIENDKTIELSFSDYYQPHPNHQPSSKFSIKYTEKQQYLPRTTLEDELNLKYGWESPKKMNLPPNTLEFNRIKKNENFVLLKSENYEERKYFLREMDKSNQFKVLSGVSAAEWDHSGRLILAREGKLYASYPHAQDDFFKQVIIDLSNEKPKTIIAPPAFSKW